MRDSDNVRAFREELHKKYDVAPGSYIVTTVVDSLIKKMVDQSSRLDEI